MKKFKKSEKIPQFIVDKPQTFVVKYNQEVNNNHKERGIEVEVDGKKISEIRRRKDMTQQELAKRVGVHHTHISKVEREKENPSMKLLIKMAEVLDCKVQDFFKA